MLLGRVSQQNNWTKYDIRRFALADLLFLYDRLVLIYFILRSAFFSKVMVAREAMRVF